MIQTISASPLEPTVCTYNTQDANQNCGKVTADQRLFLANKDITVPGSPTQK